MRLVDVLRTPFTPERTGSPDADALFDAEALVEAYVVGIQSHAVLNEAWVLFDCRGALQIQTGNTAVLAVEGVELLSWRTGGGASGRRQWTVLSWLPRMTASGWGVTAGLHPAARLEIEARSARFYIGDVPGGDSPPPDFIDSTDNEIRNGLAHWTSEFDVLHSSVAPRSL